MISLSIDDKVKINPHGSLQKEAIGKITYSNDSKRVCNVRLDNGKVYVAVNYFHVEKLA